jgi:hypothetical protein
LENNLLTYDALGCFAHLETWLHDRTSPSTPEEAQVLAIKYENLWDPETVKAIREFLNLSEFFLPLYINRGTFEQFPQEILFKQANNLGTEEHPIYPAYDRARVLWENAPPFEYLKIID